MLAPLPSLSCIRLRAGRRGGDGYGVAWLMVGRPVAGREAAGMARALFGPAAAGARVDRRTRRRTLVVWGL